jgi:hypothetical protein
MGRSEIARRRHTRALDRSDSEANVATYEKWTFELQLFVEVPVIPKLVTLVRDPSYELRPALGVAAEHEEGGPDSFLGESVEDEWSCIRVRSIIECQSNNFLIARDSSQCTTEDRAISVERAVYGSSDH